MKYVALLRGINVGGRTIKMAELKACLESQGMSAVMTVLQSGNVLFDSSITERQQLRIVVEKALTATFAYSARATVLRASELTTIVADYPLQDSGSDMHRYVIFVDGAAEELVAGAVLDPSIEAVAPGDGVVYWRVLKGRTLDSDFAKRLATYSATHFATNRNVNTLQKIINKA